jgi:uncharacterized protein YjbI with pentapeptide repeats
MNLARIPDGPISALAPKYRKSNYNTRWLILRGIQYWVDSWTPNMNSNISWQHPHAFPVSFARRQQESKERSQRDDQLSNLIASVNDDVSDTRKELFAFIVTLAFVIVTNYSITPRDLLTLTPARLPFINLSVPLHDFLFWTPLVIFAVHVVFLMRLARLREKLRVTRNAILSSPKNERTVHFMKITSNFLTQLFVTKPDASGWQLLLRLVYYFVVFIVPFMTLLAIVVRALPLHDVELTFFQNLWLSADTNVAFYLFQRHRKTYGFSSFVLTFSLANLVLCVPDSNLDRVGAWLCNGSIISPTSGRQRAAFLLTALIFESEVDAVTRRPRFFGLSRNIVMVDDKPMDRARTAFPGVEGLSGAALGGAVLGLRGRDLRYAIFDRSDLSGADLFAADLYRASLLSVDFSRAQFGCLNEVRCTNLEGATLEGADLRGAKFRGLDTKSQPLSGINLSGAHLEGVDLQFVNLSRADLSQAKLIGAYLDFAKFIGARLDEADLTGVRARHADFSFSSMLGTHLDGASLEGARFLASDMRKVSLFKAHLGRSDMRGAVLRNANVWETETPAKQAMAWTDLEGVIVKPFGDLIVPRLQRAIDDNPDLTIAAVDADVPVNPWDIGLKHLRDAAKVPTPHFAFESEWEEATKILAKKRDASYIEAYRTALVQIACLEPSYVETISTFPVVYLGRGGGLLVPRPYLFEEEYQEIISDTRLKQLKSWPAESRQNNFASDYVDDGPTPMSMFDISRLTTLLDGESMECPAAINVSAQTRERLREATTSQRAYRNRTLKGSSPYEPNASKR